MNFFKKSTVVLFLLAVSLFNAQDLGLATGGNKILSELAKAFPIIVTISLIWVGWKALSEYNDSKDAMAVLKIIGWYLLAVFFIIGAYQVVKNLSL